MFAEGTRQQINIGGEIPQIERVNMPIPAKKCPWCGHEKECGEFKYDDDLDLKYKYHPDRCDACRSFFYSESCIHENGTWTWETEKAKIKPPCEHNIQIHYFDSWHRASKKFCSYFVCAICGANVSNDICKIDSRRFCVYYTADMQPKSIQNDYGPTYCADMVSSDDADFQTLIYDEEYYIVRGSEDEESFREKLLRSWISHIDEEFQKTGKHIKHN